MSNRAGDPISYGSIDLPPSKQQLKSILAISLLALSLLLMSQPVLSAVKPADSTLLLGVFPHFPPRTLEKIYAPVAADISKHLGSKVKLRTTKSFKKFSDKLRREEFDIVFLNPFDYIDAADNYGYVPLAARDEPLSTIIVVPENSQFTNIDDLRGKTIAMPPETAAVSYLLKGELIKQGIVPGKDIFISHHRSHLSCIQQVLIGAAPACGTAASVRRFFMNKLNAKLNIIMETSAIPHTLFAVHPRVPDKAKAIILSRILELATSEAGKEMIKRGRLKPFTIIKDEDYDIVREFRKQLQK